MGLTVSDQLVAALDHGQPDLQGRRRPVQPGALRSGPAQCRPFRGRASCRSSAPPWPACIWPRRSPATSPCRWPPARPCTATPASAAPPPTRPAQPGRGGRDPRRHARAAPELLQRAQERLPRSGIPGRQRHGPRCGGPCQARDRVRRGCPPALRAAEGEVRLARAPHDPADHLPVAGRGRGCRRQDQGRRDLRGASPPSATSLRRTWSSAPSPRPRCSTRPSPTRPSLSSRARRARRSPAGSGRCSCASRRSSPRRSVPSRRWPPRCARSSPVQRAQGRDRDGSTTRSRICAPAPSRWRISPRRRA